MDIEIAIGTWNFNLEYKNRDISLPDIASKVRKELGVKYIDLFDGHFHPEKDILDLSDRDVVEHAKKLCGELTNEGLEVVGVSAINEFSVVGEIRDTGERLRKWLMVAPLLSIRFIRLSTEMWWLVEDNEFGLFDGKRMRSHLEDLLPHFPDDWDGYLVLENHPLDIPSGQAGERYIDEMIVAVMGHDRLALCPDDGHMQWEDEDEWSAKFARMVRHAKYAHLKCGEDAFGRGKPLPWDMRLKALEEAPADGPLFVNLEHVGTGDPIPALEEAVLHL